MSGDQGKSVAFQSPMGGAGRQGSPALFTSLSLTASEESPSAYPASSLPVLPGLGKGQGHLGSQVPSLLVLLLQRGGRPGIRASAQFCTECPGPCSSCPVNRVPAGVHRAGGWWAAKPTAGCQGSSWEDSHAHNWLPSCCVQKSWGSEGSTELPPAHRPSDGLAAWLPSQPDCVLGCSWDVGATQEGPRL